MSKLSLVALIACAVSIPSAMASPWGSPNTGTVHFKGEVFKNSCKVENKGKAEVTLSPILNTKINTATAEQRQGFKIKVTECHIDENWVPKLSWERNSKLTSTSEGYLRNIISGGSNAALVLQDDKGTPINLRNPTDRYLPLSSSNNRGSQVLEYAFQVGYIRSTDTPSFMPITAGAIKAQATFSITYDL